MSPLSDTDPSIFHPTKRWLVPVVLGFGVLIGAFGRTAILGQLRELGSAVNAAAPNPLTADEQAQGQAPAGSQDR